MREKRSGGKVKCLKPPSSTHSKNDHVMIVELCLNSWYFYSVK